MPSGTSPRATNIMALRTLSARTRRSCDLVPDAERHERRARISAHGHGVGIARGESAARRARRPDRSPGAILSSSLLSAGAISTSRLPTRLRRVGLVDEIARLQIVHPFLVGGDEDVGLAAGLDLAREHRARGERQLHRYAGVFCSRPGESSPSTLVSEAAANTSSSGFFASAPVPTSRRAAQAMSEATQEQVEAREFHDACPDRCTAVYAGA